MAKSISAKPLTYHIAKTFCMCTTNVVLDTTILRSLTQLRYWHWPTLWLFSRRVIYHRATRTIGSKSTIKHHTGKSHTPNAVQWVGNPSVGADWGNLHHQIRCPTPNQVRWVNHTEQVHIKQLYSRDNATSNTELPGQLRGSSRLWYRNLSLNNSLFHRSLTHLSDIASPVPGLNKPFSWLLNSSSNLYLL